MNETDLQNTLLSLIQNLLDAREETEGEDDDNGERGRGPGPRRHL